MSETAVADLPASVRVLPELRHTYHDCQTAHSAQTALCGHQRAWRPMRPWSGPGPEACAVCIDMATAAIEAHTPYRCPRCPA